MTLVTGFVERMRVIVEGHSPSQYSSPIEPHINPGGPTTPLHHNERVPYRGYPRFSLQHNL